MCEAISLIRGHSGLRGEKTRTSLNSDSDALSEARLTNATNGSVFEEPQASSIGEFDPGSGRTLAACLTHASHGGPAMGNRRTGA
jgi:hypothetical protein